MQLHAHMRTAGLLLLLACAPCFWLWLSGAKGMQAPRGYRALLTAAPKAAWCCSLREMARAK